MISITVPKEGTQEADWVFKILLLHNVKTHGFIEKYWEMFDNKQKGITVDKPDKLVEKYKKEMKQSEEKWIHWFGGKGSKFKKGNAGELDVCIKVKGEDG